MASSLALRLLLSASRSISRPARLPNVVGAYQFHSSSRQSAHYLNANSQVFSQIVETKAVEEGRVVLVDFYAEWCKPCHMLSPILEKLTDDPDIQSGSGKPLDLVTIDTESQDGLTLSSKFGVRAMPTVIAFRDGKEVDRFVGALTEPRVRQFLERL